MGLVIPFPVPAATSRPLCDLSRARLINLMHDAGAWRHLRIVACRVLIRRGDAGDRAIAREMLPILASPQRCAAYDAQVAREMAEFWADEPEGAA